MKTLVIDRGAVRANLRCVREQAGGAALIADLSANAYGMGMLETAQLLRDEGVRDFAVSEPRDAALLRAHGFHQERIMMLRSTADPEELRELLDFGVICTAGSHDAAVAINGISEAKRIIADIQVKVDTGLGRYGFKPAEVDRIAQIYHYMSSLNVIGTFTTFSASWRSRKTTLSQLDAFNGVLDRLTELGLEPGIAHCCDSAAIFRYEFAHMDAVRVCTALSGRVPGKQVAGLVRVGQITAGLEEVGWVPKGHRYGAEHPVVTKAPTRIAVLSVGYYHGFGIDRRQQGMLKSVPDILLRRRGKLYARINGQRARVLGSPGPLHTLVDVTKIDCSVGDVATLDVDPVNVKGLSVTYR